MGKAVKLIIAGTRTMDLNYQALEGLINNFRLDPDVVVSGGCRGIDGCGAHWAAKNNISIKQFDPAWGLEGKKAGPIRNAMMAEYADELLLIWDGVSPGSFSMRQEMMKRGKPIYEIILIRPVKK